MTRPSRLDELMRQAEGQADEWSDADEAAWRSENDRHLEYYPPGIRAAIWSAAIAFGMLVTGGLVWACVWVLS